MPDEQEQDEQHHAALQRIQGFLEKDDYLRDRVAFALFVEPNVAKDFREELMLFGELWSKIRVNHTSQLNSAD